jgi:hypothetical protein
MTKIILLAIRRVTKGSIHIERAEAIGPNVDSPGCESGSELEDDAAVVKEQLVAIVTAHEESLRREAAGESGETAGPQAAAEATATTSEKAVRGAAAGHGHGQHGSVHGQNTSMRGSDSCLLPVSDFLAFAACLTRQL